MTTSINNLPNELIPNIKKFVIGYKYTITHPDNTKEELWAGDTIYKPGNYKNGTQTDNFGMIQTTKMTK